MNKMPWLLREHNVPNDYPIGKIRRKVRNKYLSAVENDTIPTSFDINDWIKRKFGDPGERSITLSIQVSPQLYESSAIEESMDTYYEEIKPSTQKKKLSKAKKYVTANRCPICLSSGLQYKVFPCGCHFHKKCIEESLRWNPNCPTCQTPINASDRVEKCKRKGKKRPRTSTKS